MSIVRAIFMTLVILCTSNALAECQFGTQTFQTGTIPYIMMPDIRTPLDCVNNFIFPSDKRAKTITLVCRSDGRLVCVATSCQDENAQPDKNGICVVNPKAYHEKVITTDLKTSDFFESCLQEKKDTAKTSKGTIKTICIKKFANVNASPNIALKLIETFNFEGVGKVQKKNCTTNLSRGGHFIQCKSNSNVYVEYKFAGINNSLLREAELAAQLCPLFDMEQMRYPATQCSKGEQTPEKCAKLSSLLEVDMFTSYMTSGNRCELSNDFKTGAKLPEIDSNIFSDINSYPSAEIKSVVTKYINDSFSSRPSLVFYPARDAIWPIEINGELVAFKFSHLSSNDWASNNFFEKVGFTSTEQMSCVMHDGLSDGRHCWLLEDTTEEENKSCIELDKFIKTFYKKSSSSVGTDFDDGVCTLKRSNTEYNTAKWVKIGSQVAGLVLITVATAGTGSVAAITFTMVGAAADGVAIGEEVKMSNSAVKFLKRSTKCNKEKCAGELFDTEFTHMLQLLDHISPGEIRAVDAEMSRLVDLIPSDSGIFKKFMDMKKQAVATMAPEEIIQTVAIIVSLASAGANLGSKLMGKVGTTPKFLVKFQDKAKNVMKITKKVSEVHDTALDVSTMADYSNVKDTGAAVSEARSASDIIRRGARGAIRVK